MRLPDCPKGLRWKVPLVTACSQPEAVRGEKSSVGARAVKSLRSVHTLRVLRDASNQDTGSTLARATALSITPAEGAKRFGELIEATSRLVGVPAEKVWIEKESKDYHLASFSSADIDCALSFRFHTPDTLFIHCQFGPLPKEPRGAKAMLSLLQLNLMLYEDRSPTFAADLEGNVMLCMAVPLERMLDAQSLAGVLENLAAQATSWREVWLAES